VKNNDSINRAGTVHIVSPSIRGIYLCRFILDILRLNIAMHVLFVLVGFLLSDQGKSVVYLALLQISLPG